MPEQINTKTNADGSPEADSVRLSALLGGFVIVSTECMDCGGQTAITLLDHEPSKEEIEMNKDALGGMWCIRTDVLKIKVNGEPQITKSA